MKPCPATRSVTLNCVIEIRPLHLGGPQTSRSPRRNRFERPPPSRSPPHGVPRIPHQPRPHRSHTAMFSANPSRGWSDAVQVGLLQPTGIPYPELPVISRNMSSVVGRRFLHSREFPSREQVSCLIPYFSADRVFDITHPAIHAAT